MLVIFPFVLIIRFITYHHHHPVDAAADVADVGAAVDALYVIPSLNQFP